MGRRGMEPKPARIELSLRGEDLVLDAKCQYMGVKLLIDWKDFLRGLQELQKNIIISKIEAGQKTLQGGP